MSCLERPEQSSLSERLRLALKDWHSTSQDKNTLADLYLFRNVQREEQLTARQATNSVLRRGIEQLREGHVKDAELLEARFMDNASIQKLSHQYNVAESTLYSMQRDAVDRLADILDVYEQKASAEQKALLLHRLDAATYERLIGIDAIEDSLLSKVVGSEPPWLISLEGIGGIGKTSLAHKLMTKVINSGTYSEIGWVSARQRHLNLGGGISDVAKPALTAESLVERLLAQLMPEYAAAATELEQQLRMLQTLLKDVPHLIVVDNLETLMDVEELLPTLYRLSNPSRFVLTSRISLYAGANIFHFGVPELNQKDALTLVRQEAKWSNLSELAESTDAQLQPIYRAVGGNPLALRLIVGQNHIYPLNEILKDVSSVKTEATQNLYTYIYKQAWQSLDPRSRQVLMAMPLGNPNGDDIEFLATVGDLSVDEMRMGLNHLVRLNLVDARGGLNERRYSIHGLTRAFLHKNVVGWMTESNG